MSAPNDGYRDEGREGRATADNKAERDTQVENQEAEVQARRDRLSDYADHDWSEG